jgi:hypothetical protein
MMNAKSIKQENSVIDYLIFREVQIKLASKNVTEENLEYVDIGDIHLRLEGREYQLDYLAMGRSLNDDGTIDITLTLGSFEDAKECFEDCDFNLTLEDLINPKLLTTVYIGSDEDDIELEFISGVIIGNHDNKTDDYFFITINAND